MWGALTVRQKAAMWEAVSALQAERRISQRKYNPAKKNYPSVIVYLAGRLRSSRRGSGSSGRDGRLAGGETG